MSKKYVDMIVSDLREECKKRNLDGTGLKVHLVERLNKYDKEQDQKDSVSKLESLPKTTTKDVRDEKISLENNSINGVSSLDGKDINNIVSREREFDNYELKTREFNYYDSKTLFKMSTVEFPNWEERTNTHLDYYVCDLNLVIDEGGYYVQPLKEEGFDYLFGGVKGNYGVKSGKVYYEVKIKKFNDTEPKPDLGEANVVRIGWSVNSSSLRLGEEVLSFSYENNGRKMTENSPIDYGIKFGEGDVVACYLNFLVDHFIIRYTVNGENQGDAFSIPIGDLKNNCLFPHIYSRSVVYEVNFGQMDPWCPLTMKSNNSNEIIDTTWLFIDKVNINQRIRARKPPKTKGDCEVLMMCGLPSCGKTSWCENHMKVNPNKQYNLISLNAILEFMKASSLRKKVSSAKWESFIHSANQCLMKMFEIAASRRRNYILDQTNVYPTAQRRRMSQFEEFMRKAIVIIPADDEYRRRMNQVIKEEGKDVPESAVLQMKENFVIPETNSEMFNEIIFVELQRSEAEKLVKQYNEEAKTKNSRVEEWEETENENDKEQFGLWDNSPKSTTKVISNDANEPPVKKSRWGNEGDDRKAKESRSHSSSSTSKSNYKGGFCFSREAGDDDDDSRRDSSPERNSRDRVDRYNQGRRDSDSVSNSRFGGNDHRRDNRSQSGRAWQDGRGDSYNSSSRDSHDRSRDRGGQKGGRFGGDRGGRSDFSDKRSMAGSGGYSSDNRRQSSDSYVNRNQQQGGGSHFSDRRQQNDNFQDRRGFADRRQSDNSSNERRFSNSYGNDDRQQAGFDRRQNDAYGDNKRQQSVDGSGSYENYRSSNASYGVADKRPQDNYGLVNRQVGGGDMCGQYSSTLAQPFQYGGAQSNRDKSWQGGDSRGRGRGTGSTRGGRQAENTGGYDSYQNKQQDVYNSYNQEYSQSQQYSDRVLPSDYSNDYQEYDQNYEYSDNGSSNTGTNKMSGSQQSTYQQQQYSSNNQFQRSNVRSIGSSDVTTASQFSDRGRGVKPSRGGNTRGGATINYSQPNPFSSGAGGQGGTYDGNRGQQKQQGQSSRFDSGQNVKESYSASYGEPQQQGGSFASGRGGRGGQSRFGSQTRVQQKPHQHASFDNSSQQQQMDYGDGYENYQSYDNSTEGYNQNSNYYDNYYSDEQQNYGQSSHTGYSSSTAAAQLPVNTNNYANPYNTCYDSNSNNNTGGYNSSFGGGYYGQTNTYAQSGTYDSSTTDSSATYGMKQQSSHQGVPMPPPPMIQNQPPPPQSYNQYQSADGSVEQNNNYNDYSEFYQHYSQQGGYQK